MRKISLVVLLQFLFGLSLAAQTSPIKVGWIGPMTGPLAKWGSYQAAQLAMEEINSTGGINGRPLEVIFEDGKGQGKEAVNAVHKLLEVDHVKYILGGHCSPESLAMAPIVERADDSLMIAAVTSSPLLTGAGGRVSRLTAVSTRGTEEIFNYATRVLAGKSFAVLYEEADYPRPQAEKFRDLAKTSGIIITDYEGVLPNETDFRSVLLRVISKKPDALYLATISPDTASLLMEQLRQLKSSILVLGNENTGHAVDSSQKDKGAFEGIIFASSSYQPGDSVAKTFRDKYSTRYNVDALPYGAYTAEAYDSLHLLAELIGRCGDSNAKVNECLRQVKDYHGASGVFSINSNGDAIREYEMHVVKNGRVSALER